MRLLAAFAILSSFVAFASALDAPVAARDVDADAEAARTALKEELKLAASLALHENRDISIEDRSDVGSVSDSMLEDRALTTCPDKNGCTCKKTQQGQYCGACQEVKTYGRGGSINHIYECNRNGGCCNYGASKKCAGSYASSIEWCPK